MYEESYAEDKAVATDPGTFAGLDDVIERLVSNIGRLEQRLTPVLNQYGHLQKVQTADVPHPEPSSRLRGCVDQLRKISEHVESLISDLDL